MRTSWGPVNNMMFWCKKKFMNLNYHLQLVQVILLTFSNSQLSHKISTNRFSRKCFEDLWKTSKLIILMIRFRNQFIHPQGYCKNSFCQQFSSGLLTTVCYLPYSGNQSNKCSNNGWFQWSSKNEMIFIDIAKTFDQLWH